MFYDRLGKYGSDGNDIPNSAIIRLTYFYCMPKG